MLRYMDAHGTTLVESIESVDSFGDEQKKSDGLYYMLAHGEDGTKIHDQLPSRVCAKIIAYVRTRIERTTRQG